MTGQGRPLLPRRQRGRRHERSGGMCGLIEEELRVEAEDEGTEERDGEGSGHGGPD